MEKYIRDNGGTIKRMVRGSIHGRTEIDTKELTGMIREKGLVEWNTVMANFMRVIG